MTSPVSIPAPNQPITGDGLLDRIWRVFFSDVQALLNREARPGSIVYLREDADTSGYLRADGSSVSRTLYANVFALYGTDYGAGDGSTTFGMPTISSVSPSSGPDFLAYVKV